MDICVRRIPKRCIYLSRNIKISSVLCICISSSLFANVCALKLNELLFIFNSHLCSHEKDMMVIPGLIPAGLLWPNFQINNMSKFLKPSLNI